MRNYNNKAMTEKRELTTAERILFEEVNKKLQEVGKPSGTEDQFLKNVNFDSTSADAFMSAMERYAKMKWEEGGRAALQSFFDTMERRNAVEESETVKAIFSTFVSLNKLTPFPIPDFKP